MHWEYSFLFIQDEFLIEASFCFMAIGHLFGTPFNLIYIAGNGGPPIVFCTTPAFGGNGSVYEAESILLSGRRKF